MAEDENPVSPEVDQEEGASSRQPRRKPTKALPNNRIVFQKHLDILRGYAAASGFEKKAVSNDDVAAVVAIHSGTISNCNPFFSSIGLLKREKNGYVPADEVFAYAERYKWEADKAAFKLQPLIRASWFSAALLSKLAFRPLSKEEALAYLAEEAGADPEYRQHLDLLIEYMRAAGLVSVDGNTITLIDSKPADSTPELPVHQSPSTTTPLPQFQPSPIDQQIRAIHPSIIGVLLKLPPVETDWSLKDKKRFMSALGAVLDLVYDLEEEDKLV